MLHAIDKREYVVSARGTEGRDRELTGVERYCHGGARAPESESRSSRGWSDIVAKTERGGATLPRQHEAPKSQSGGSKGWGAIVARAGGGGEAAAVVLGAEERERGTDLVW